MSIKPLKGIKVLDFSKVLAGPLCTQGLADLGADVIKVEDCRQGDDTRGWPPFRNGEGAVFLFANRKKRSIAIDLKKLEAKAIVEKLVAEADVVIESFGPGVPEKLSIDYAALKKIKPDLIYCSVSGFGRTGPLAHGKGYDMILQAFTGMVSIMGEPGGGPVRAPFSPIDQGTGMHAQTAILAALLNRNLTGEGCHIEVSLFDTGIAFLGYMMQSFWEKGAEPARFGCAHESLCPYQAFVATDGLVLIGVASDALWVQLCDALEMQELKTDPRFSKNAARVQNRDVTVEIVQTIIGRKSSEHWVDLFTAKGIPSTRINNFGEALSHPHTQSSGLIMDYESERFGRMKSIGQPIRFNGNRADAGTAPPRQGEQSREILIETGMSAEEIESMFRDGVVCSKAE